MLVINCGSSSLKYSFFDTRNDRRTTRGQVERIGSAHPQLVQRGPGGDIQLTLPPGGHHEAFDAMLRELSAPGSGVIQHPSQIGAIGHRVVHGGAHFTEPTLITDTVMAEIKALAPLAPLHNSVNVAGIREARRAFSTAPQVAVFDTAFHRTIPDHASIYGLPYEFFQQHGVRRYGFHGTSHAYVCRAAAHYLGRRWDQLRIISCHLGNGASLCAVDRGRSVDTTMGLTPGEGLIMGTRCGDLDSGAFAYLERAVGLNAAQIDELLNQRSGLLGLSGISGDMREIEAAAAAGNPRARLAHEAFCYRVRKYLGAFFAVLGVLDLVIFTGGIGQGRAGVRSRSLQGLHSLGIHLDARRNRDTHGFDRITRISTTHSPVTVLVVPTDEEWMIAQETLRACRPLPAPRHRSSPG